MQPVGETVRECRSAEELKRATAPTEDLFTVFNHRHFSITDV